MARRRTNSFGKCATTALASSAKAIQSGGTSTERRRCRRRHQPKVDAAVFPHARLEPTNASPHLAEQTQPIKRVSALAEAAPKVRLAIEEGESNCGGFSERVFAKLRVCYSAHAH